MFKKNLILHSADLGTGGGEGGEGNPSLNTHLAPPTPPKEDEPPKFGIEDFKKFMAEDSDAKLLIQQQNQAMIDKGVQTLVEKERDSIRAEAVAQSQNLTPEALQIQDLTRKFEDSQREAQIEKNKTSAFATLANIDVPSDVKPSLQAFAAQALVSHDPEKTMENLNALNYILEKVSTSTKRDSVHTNVAALGNQDVTPQQRPLQQQGQQGQVSNGQLIQQQNQQARSIISNIISGK